MVTRTWPLKFLSNRRTVAYTERRSADATRELEGTVLEKADQSAMRKTRTKTKASSKPDWAAVISGLRQRLGLSQTAFGNEVHSSAMGVSRWERGAQEPPSHSYIELGNLAGDPECWFFWGRAGLRSEDLMRVLPKLRNRFPQSRLHDF